MCLKNLLWFIQEVSSKRFEKKRRPVVQTFAEKPGVVLAPANSWWSKNTSIPHIQKSVMAAWARLFDVPVATSHNF